MITATQRLGAMLLALAAATSAAAQPFAAPADVDTSEWECDYCPEPAGGTGWLAIGLGTVSGQAYKFADYRDLEDGTYGLGDGSAYYLSDEYFWRLRASSLFLDNRNLSIEGGKPGAWWIDVEYDDIVRFINETGATPYGGVGSDTLTLPEDWVFGIGVPGLSELEDSLRPLDLNADRQRFRLGVAFTPPGRFDYALSYQRETREGVRHFAGANLFNASLLPAPVDYVTDEVNASVTYLTDRWQLGLSYYGSFFANDARSFTWEVPYQALMRGAEVGQYDLGPDNQYHLVSLSGHYRFDGPTHVSGQLSVGRMTQDEPFLAYTTNPLINVGALPRGDLDGKVDVLDLVTRLRTEIFGGMGLSLSYRLNDRENDSPVDLFTPVTMDLYVNPPRANDPFSWKRQRVEAEVDRRLGSMARWHAGLEYTDTEREFDQRADTDETGAWTRLRISSGGTIEASIKFAGYERDGAVLEPVPGVNLAENPAARKYNYADRDRVEAQAMLAVMPAEWLQLTFVGSIANDDYDDSVIGLTESDYSDATIDVAIVPNEIATIHAYYTRENFDTQIAGEAVSTASFTGRPNWFASIDDRIDTAGLGVAFQNIKDLGLDLSLDYFYSNADSRYDVDDGSGVEPFPEFRNDMDGIRLRGSYPLASGARIFVEYYREDYESDDWAIDGLEADTVVNLLAFGELAHNYGVDTIAVWYRRPF